jgi:large conductance mechanosensitive channel
MGLLQEFKEFALKGSVVDLAVGVIIGGAFGKIVSSLVNDVIMPPLGLLMGGADFSNKWIILHAAKVDPVTGKEIVPQSVLKYGLFINNVIDFLIVAIAIFAVIKLMNMARRGASPPPPPGEPTTKECPMCLSTIAYKARKCPQCTSDLPATA